MSVVFQAPTVIGRDADLRRIEAYVDSLATGGSARLLTGAAGVGKSLLLDLAASAAADRDVRVLRCDGVEFEVEVAFSALNQALLPLRREIRKLDAAQRSAVQVALGLSTAPPHEPLVVSNAVLELLERAAATQPLLVIVDDAQWLDRATALTLAFVARRLSGLRVGMLIGARTGADNIFQSLELESHELQPLDDREANELIALRFPSLDQQVTRRLTADAQGNPLALLELPVPLTGSQRAAHSGLPSTLPLTDRLQAAFADRLEELDTATRAVLLRAALEGTGRLGVLQRAAGVSGGVERLESAERVQLLTIDEESSSVRFRHPLVRGAVVGASTHDERRRAHKSLADVLVDEPDRHVWHRAAASVGPDADVALLLEQAAHRALRRGDGVGAVTALVRAADLSPLASERSSKLAEAAYIGANLSGKLDTIGPLIEGARLADATPSARLYGTLAAASVFFESGDELETAHRMIVGAIDAHVGTWDENDQPIEHALGLLLSVSAFLGIPEVWEPFHAGVARLHNPPSALRLMAQLIPDPARASRESLRELDAELEDLASEPDPWRVSKLCAAGMWIGGRYRPGPLLRILRRSEEEDLAPGMIVHAHQWLALHYFHSGQWERAHQHIDDGLRVCATMDYASMTWMLRALRMLQAAAEGDDLFVTMRDEGVRWAGPRHAHGVLHPVYQASALSALGRGDYDEAFEYVTRITPPGLLASHAPRALQTCMDLVDAALHSGRRAEAVVHVNALHDARIAVFSPRLALLVAASEALICEDDDDAAHAFHRALVLPDIDRWPFDQARVRLSFGQRLRRSRATSEARTQLREALTTFEELGAQPWVERAKAELLATGETRLSVDEGARFALTAQERAIAHLAASGLTNKEIGTRLFLSHRTVGSHLRHVFPKLGITSRAALRDALDRAPAV